MACQNVMNGVLQLDVSSTHLRLVMMMPASTQLSSGSAPTASAEKKISTHWLASSSVLLLHNLTWSGVCSRVTGADQEAVQDQVWQGTAMTRHG